MNTFLLMTALRDALITELATLPLPTRTREIRPEQEQLRPAKLHVGSLPPKTVEGFDAPEILIQAMNGHESDDGFAHMEVALRFVVWNEEIEGAENDLHNLIGLVRRKVMSCRQFPLAGKFVLTADSQGKFAPWARPDEQAPPFAEAHIITNWNMQGME